jgi:hypothetical protein
MIIICNAYITWAVQRQYCTLMYIINSRKTAYCINHPKYICVKNKLILLPVLLMIVCTYLYIGLMTTKYSHQGKGYIILNVLTIFTSSCMNKWHSLCAVNAICSLIVQEIQRHNVFFKCLNSLLTGPCTKFSTCDFFIKQLPL